VRPVVGTPRAEKGSQGFVTRGEENILGRRSRLRYVRAEGLKSRFLEKNEDEDSLRWGPKRNVGGEYPSTGPGKGTPPHQRQTTPK